MFRVSGLGVQGFRALGGLSSFRLNRVWYFWVWGLGVYSL